VKSHDIIKVARYMLLLDMAEFTKFLSSEWEGIPMVIWLGFISILGLIVLRGRSFRFLFKSRDRQIRFETGGSIARDKHEKPLKTNHAP
jgi:hypothetical protein